MCSPTPRSLTFLLMVHGATMGYFSVFLFQNWLLYLRNLGFFSHIHLRSGGQRIQLIAISCSLIAVCNCCQSPEQALAGTVIQDITTSTSISMVSGRLFPNCGVMCAPGWRSHCIHYCTRWSHVSLLGGSVCPGLEFAPRPDFLLGHFSDAIWEGSMTI